MSIPRCRITGRSSLGLVSVLLLPISVWSQAKTDPMELLKQPTPPPTARVAYGKDSVQFGELRVPPGPGPFPVAILVHGGCWSVKLPDLPESVTSFELLRPIAAALTDQGIASWNIEYRRLGNEGGGWPGTYQDLSRATDMLRDLAPRYHLDLSRVVAMGHSSGGQLSMWLVARGKLSKNSPLYTDSPLPLRGVVLIDGVADLATFQPAEQAMCGGPAITQFMGGTPAQVPDRYREGSITSLLPVGVKQELFIRDRPPEMVAAAEQYVRMAEKAGDPVRIFSLKGTSHFDPINPGTQDWASILATLRALQGNP